MSVELEKGLVTVLSGVGVARPNLPQPPTFPAIRYQRIYTTRTTAVDGLATGAVEVGMQIDCMAESYLAAKTLADSVRVALHNYAGTWGTLKAFLVVLDTENDFNELDGDRATYWVTQRYKIHTNDS